MNNTALIAFTWCAVAVHVLVAIAALRRWTTLPLVPALNLAVSLCLLAYWLVEWYGYLFRNITWYPSEQWLPLYALLACVLSLLAITGRYDTPVLSWTVFIMHSLTLLAAAVFFSLFKMDRLI
jgi:hypothetical protein